MDGAQACCRQNALKRPTKAQALWALGALLLLASAASAIVHLNLLGDGAPAAQAPYYRVMTAGSSLVQLGAVALMAWGFFAMKGRSSLGDLALDEVQGFKALLDATCWPVYCIDLEGRCTFCNRACLRLLGYERAAQLLGSNMQAAVFGEVDGAEEPCRITSAMLAGKSLHVAESAARRADGSRIAVERWADLIHWEGAVSGAAVSLVDLTQSKAARAALKRDREALELQVRDLSQHSTEMAHFGQLAEMLQACSSIEELCRIVSVFSKNLFPEDSGTLYILETVNLMLDPQVSWGHPDPPESVAFHLQDCWSIRRGKPHYQEEAQEDIFCTHISHPSPAYSFCLPLTGQGGNLGMLHLRAGSKGALMSEPRQLVAIAFAYQVALGLSNLRLKDILREEAIRDPVTGLFNRRFMNESLDHEIHRARRTGTQVAVIAFDLDHFKDVNDTLGHAAGDALLAVLANLAKGCLRASDISCRQGGDEFLLIMPDIAEADAVAVAENLRKRAEHFTRIQFPEMAGKVTISAGVALFPQDAATPESLQKAADKALYRAKLLGRNQVFAASRLGADEKGAAALPVDIQPQNV